MKFAARHIVCFTALPYVRTRRAQELVGQVVACIWIANAHRLARGDAIGKPVALVDVKDDVLPQYRYDTRCGVIVRALVTDLQLFDEIDFRAALALANVAT
jgi:hypothetical protein